MGLIEFVVLVLVVCAICYLGTLFAAKVAPNHPVAVDWLLWGVGLFIIVVALAKATGLAGYDPLIPRLR